jgi:hypothetical protein
MTLTAASFGDAVSLVRAVVWPLAVLLIVLVLLPYFPQIGRWLDRRLTKVSWASASVEFAVATEVKPEIWGSLQGLRDPGGDTALVGGDAGRVLFELIKLGERSESAVLDLGAGDQWLTSRLYIFGLILSELSGVRSLVFVETRAGIPKRFVGLANPGDVRRTLGSQYPWFEKALLSLQINLNLYGDESKRLLNEMKTFFTSEPEIATYRRSELDPMIRPLIGFHPLDPADPDAAQTVANGFLGSPLIAEWVNPTEEGREGWVQVGRPSPDGRIREERAEWIKNADHLTRLLGSALTFDSLVEEAGLPANKLERQVVLADGAEFVAALDHEGRFKRLINRQALALQAARRIAESKNNG